jgi:hypothetical protein
VKTKLYGYPILMKAGLGNMLIPWAKCYLWCRDNDARMIAPFWTKLRIGPYLRREKDKRDYQRLFRPSAGISGLERIFLLAMTKKCSVENYDNSVSSGRGITAMFEGMENFQQLVGQHDEIRQALTAMTRPEFLPAKPARPFIGVHVRLGDYAAPQNGAEVPWTSRLPLDWYLAAVLEVRKTAGFECDVIVFSDGSDAELGALLALPAVRRSAYKESISDILSLSHAAVVIGSCSSFSMWGAYLAQTFTVWHQGRVPGKIMAEQKSKEYETEWLPGMSLPASFKNGLRRVLAT